MAIFIAAAPLTAHASQNERMSFRCDRGRSFQAALGKDHVVVPIGARRLILQSQPSSPGRRYEAPGSVLIIDGDLSALVIDDDLGFRNCRVSSPALG